MSKKIRVLQVTKFYPPHIGGIETTTNDIVDSLKSSGQYEIEVLAYGDEKKDVFEDKDGVKIIRAGTQLNISHQPIAKNYYKLIKSAIKEFKPDIIHFHYPNPYAAHWLLKAMKKYKFKGKLILHWHADIIRQKFLRTFFIHQNKALLKRADVIIATSPNYLNDTDYLPHYKDKVRIIPSCISENRTVITDEEIQKSKAIKAQYKGKNICFFYGRHTAYKGLEYLIDSDQYLNKDKIQIIIAGKGELTEKLKEKAKPFPNISFVGKLSEEDINSYFLACDIFVFPSVTRNEAFGLALAEAMYYGKPACTFTIKGSGVNWVSLNGVTGLEAPDYDYKKFAENISTLCNDNEMRKRMSEKARERGTSLFTKDKFAIAINDLYNSLGN